MISPRILVARNSTYQIVRVKGWIGTFVVYVDTYGTGSPLACTPVCWHRDGTAAHACRQHLIRQGCYSISGYGSRHGVNLRKWVSAEDVAAVESDFDTAIALRKVALKSMPRYRSARR